MPMPRLKISHQLSLLMAAVAVLAVLVVGGLSDYNLRSGFSDYLKVRDDEQLMRLVALIEQRAATDPDFGWLRDQPEAMRDLIDVLTGRPARGQGPPPPRDFAALKALITERATTSSTLRGTAARTCDGGRVTPPACGADGAEIGCAPGQ